MPLLYHAYVYLEFLILACTIYILAPKCLIKKDDGTLSLTEQGQQIYEKHQFFTKRLVEAGVPQDIAAQDACKLEYVISEISFKKLKEAVWINDREVIPSEK